MEMKLSTYAARVKVDLAVGSNDSFTIARASAAAGQVAAALGCPVITSMSTVGNDLTIWFATRY